MIDFEFVSINHLIKLLDELRFDQIVRKAWEYFDKLSYSLPIVAKFCQIPVYKV